MRLVKKAQQALRKWEENLAEAQSTVQECTQNVNRAQERLARNQAIRLVYDATSSQL